MFVDICLPNNNEEEFLKVAKELGTKKILFLYEKVPKKKPELYDLICKKNPPNKDYFYFSIAEEFMINNKAVKFHFGAEKLEKKDALHQRNSGINHILARTMSEKEKVYVICFEDLLKESKVRLGRLKQNLKLLRKYDVPFIITSFASNPENLRSEVELKSLIKTLGFEKQAKKAVTILEEILDKNSKV